MLRMRFVGVVVALAALLPAAAAFGSDGNPSNVTGGGGAGGGVVDDPDDQHRLAEFVFGINGDRFGADQAELEVTLTWTAYGDGEEPDVVCEYQGVTGPSGQVSYVDTGSSITVIIDGRIDGPVVGEGAGCDDELLYAELETFYANESLTVESSFVDQDGVRCRRLLRSNEAGTASAVVETDDGVFIDATGLVGSGGYSREEFICPAWAGS